MEKQSMSFHNEYERWLSMTEIQNCPICNQLPMPEGMEDIVELPNSWLSAEPVECLKGACHLVAKKHAVELYELNEDELLAWMKEVQLCARALKRVTNAVKINYEIHGNTIPHLHIHLYPRYKEDPFPGQPIDYNQKTRLYTTGEFETFVNNMRAEITAERARK